MFTIPWDVKEPTHYSKRVGHEVPGVVAVLCESIAGPHQLIPAKKTQPAQSNKRKKERKKGKRGCRQAKTWLVPDTNGLLHLRCEVSKSNFHQQPHLKIQSLLLAQSDSHLLKKQDRICLFCRGWKIIKLHFFGLIESLFARHQSDNFVISRLRVLDGVFISLWEKKIHLYRQQKL